MSTLRERIAARLDRLRTPADKRQARKSSDEMVVEAAEAAEPPTLAGLRADLNKLADEIARQGAIISGAEAERDRILDAVDGDDAEVLEIDRRVALARLAIDRLKRLEEEAFAEVAPLELAEQQARWVHARGEYLKLAQAMHAAMVEFETAAARLWAYRVPLFNAVGVRDWEQQLPPQPFLAQAVGGRIAPFDSNAYRTQADRFSKVMVGDPAAASLSFPDRLTRYIAGKIPVSDVTPPTGVWGGNPDSGGDHPVLVRLSRQITLPDGEVLPLGATVKVRAAHARDLVAANRAVLSDTLTDWNYHPLGANTPLRELPLPAARLDA